MEEIIVNIFEKTDFINNFAQHYTLPDKKLKENFKNRKFLFNIDFTRKNLDQRRIDEITRGYFSIKGHKDFKECSITAIIHSFYDCKSHLEANKQLNNSQEVDIRYYYKVEINNNADYQQFFDRYVDVSKMELKDKYKNEKFIFVFNNFPNEKIDAFLFHNYLLIKQKFVSSDLDKFQIMIYDSSSDPNKNLGRINAYFSENNENVYFNGQPISWDIDSIKKLFPAIALDKDTYLLLKNPIPKDVWQTIISYKKINENTFENKYKKIWRILRACQNYLFDEYKDNKSTTHTYLRKIAYAQEDFWSYVKSMSLFSVLLFAQYDHYYRNFMIKNYKQQILQKCNLPKNKAVNLGAKDLLINLQHKQSKENYEQYIVCKQQKHDVKTLLKHEKSTNIDEDIISKIKNSNTAKAIKELVKTISDTFYSASSTNYIKDLSNTIFEYIFYLCNIENLDKYEFFDYFSEKLLAKQKRRSERLDKTENKHVNIPVETCSKETNYNEVQKNLIKELKELSFNVEIEDIQKNLRNYKIHNEVLTEMFEMMSVAEGLLQLVENTVFYADEGILSIRIMEDEEGGFSLNVLISDLLGNKISDKFISNIKTRTTLENTKNTMYNYLIGKGYKETLMELKLRSFFSPNDKEKEMWNEYYGIPQNQVHHYGLQIFESILKSKDGKFYVCGHGDNYGENNKYTLNFPGTSYHISMPLKHMYTENKNIINVNTFEDTISVSSAAEYEIKEICNEVKDLLKHLVASKEEKEETIKDIMEAILKKCSTNEKSLICIDASKFDNLNVEVLIKGVLGFAISHVKNNDRIEFLPIAIVNLTSHQLLESVRIISLFYNKNGISSNMKLVQIYLKGKNVGEDLLLAGDNISSISNNMMKMAMVRGNMFDCISIVKTILRRGE